MEFADRDGSQRYQRRVRWRDARTESFDGAPRADQADRPTEAGLDAERPPEIPAEEGGLIDLADYQIPHMESVLAKHPDPPQDLVKIGEQLQEADAIAMAEIRDAGLYDDIWQAFVVLLPVRSVGVMGDGRTYEHVVAMRAVETTDFMTANWARLPHEFLARVSSRIVNEVTGINRVVYDVTSKPPGTIEWE